MVQSKRIFDAFNRLNVLIVGDVMIDRYLTGRVDRISPEAPVPIVALEHSDNRLGGAANVALNIKALGATPYLCSVIGDDDSADLFSQLLPERALPAGGILRSPRRATTVKTRVMAGGQQLLRVDQEMTRDLDEADARGLVAKVRELLDQHDIHVVLFQDYNKGNLSAPVIRELLLEAVKRDIPTAVDPKFENFWAYRHVTLFKPNLKEIRAQLPDVRIDKDSLRRAAGEIRKKLENQYTLITLGDQGLYYDNNGEYEILPTQPRSIADVCGAGDTVISIVALGLALGLDMRETALLANLAGGQVCERVGVVPVDKAQLEREYEALKVE
jgi:rfaE bifunctional protein kinase chain/domain